MFELWPIMLEENCEPDYEIVLNPGRKVDSLFTAGFPTLESTADLVLESVRAGADMIELGIPFSDPVADGPVIQSSSQVALKNGVTVQWVLQLVDRIRPHCRIPIALMGYANPIVNYGTEEFVAGCEAVGVDGLIIPDLPPEEAGEFVSLCRSHSVSPILLVAPNTPDSRTRAISEMARDLVYCVTILGITGGRLSGKDALKSYLVRVRKNSTSLL